MSPHIINSDITSDGAILEVQFMIPSSLESQLKVSNKPIPQPINVKALIDTGATCCFIREDIPKKLGLNPSGEESITSATSTSEIGRAHV